MSNVISPRLGLMSLVGKMRRFEKRGTRLRSDGRESGSDPSERTSRHFSLSGQGEFMLRRDALAVLHHLHRNRFTRSTNLPHGSFSPRSHLANVVGSTSMRAAASLCDKPSAVRCLTSQFAGVGVVSMKPSAKPSAE